MSRLVEPHALHYPVSMSERWVEHVRRINQPRLQGLERLTDQLVRIQPRIRSSVRDRIRVQARLFGVSESALIGRMLEECLTLLEQETESGKG